MARAKLDLRHDDVLDIYISKDARAGEQIVVTLKATRQPGDVDVITGRAHTLTIGGNTYTVGSGLTIVNQKLMWTVTNGTFTQNVTSGKLEADDNTSGFYYLLKVNVWRQ